MTLPDKKFVDCILCLFIEKNNKYIENIKRVEIANGAGYRTDQYKDCSTDRDVVRYDIDNK